MSFSKNKLKIAILLTGIIGIVFLILGLKQLITQKNNSYSPLQNNVLSSESTPYPTITSETKQFYPVVRVVDGDTIQVLLNGKKETVRFIGIDTPETVDPRKKVECFGKEASEKTKQLLLGKSVSLEKDETQAEKDKYGRFLRYIYLEDGSFINKLLIKEGYAHEYTYANNPYIYQEEFKSAEKEARENKKGLWGDVCQKVFINPL